MITGKGLSLGFLSLGALLGAFVACSSTTTTAAATLPDVPDAAAADDAPAEEEPAPGCPTASNPKAAGALSASEIVEASGIVASTFNPDVYWVHNDSGDTARAFAIGTDGTLKATLAFDTAAPRDIEDIAIEDESPERSLIYFGDIGDNDAVRTELTIHRVVEPKIGGAAKLVATSEKMIVTYVDGAHNAETLLFDPLTKDLLIATKKAGGPSAIHRIGPFVAGGKARTEKIASVAIDLATGGEISRDGKYIAIRSYATSALLWTRAPGESIATALARAPCKIPVATEAQGEAFAFLPGAKGYVTLGEGASASLNVALFR